MRPPWIQVTQETWGKARALAGVLGCDRHRALALVVDLWAWGLEQVEEGAPVSEWGNIVSPFAPQLLAGALDWNGEPGQLVAAFEALGLVSKLEIGFRIRGLDRYFAIVENNRTRSENGKKAAQKRWADAKAMRNACGSDAEPMRPACEGDAKGMRNDAKTQTQTHSTALRAVGADLSTGFLRDQVEGEFRKDRGESYVWTNADDVAAGKLLGYARQDGKDAREVVRRWATGLRARYRRVSTLPELAKSEAWNAHAKAEPAPEAPNFAVAGDIPRTR